MDVEDEMNQKELQMEYWQRITCNESDGTQERTHRKLVKTRINPASMTLCGSMIYCFLGDSWLAIGANGRQGMLMGS